MVSRLLADLCMPLRLVAGEGFPPQEQYSRSACDVGYRSLILNY